MAEGDVFRALLEHASVQGSRSSALKPLGWLIALLFPGTIAALAYKAPTWLIATLTALIAGAVLFYIGCYAYLLIKDRDALRSERYSLQKLAIEKGLYGDSLRGLLDAVEERTLIASGVAESQRHEE